MYTYIHCYFSKFTFFIHFFLVYPYFSSLSIIISVVCRYNRSNRRVRGGFGVGLIKFFRVREGLGMYYLFKFFFILFIIFLNQNIIVI